MSPILSSSIYYFRPQTKLLKYLASVILTFACQTADYSSIICQITRVNIKTRKI